MSGRCPHSNSNKICDRTLQFVSFGKDQREILKRASDLPGHVATVIDAFEHGLSQEELEDPAYRIKVGLVPMVAKKPGAADVAVEVLARGSDEAAEAEKIILTEVARTRYTRAQVIGKIREAGFSNFGPHQHTQLARRLDARNPGKGYGTPGDYANTWVWYDRWIERVLEECGDKGDIYR
jgi:hypothetical protein